MAVAAILDEGGLEAGLHADHLGEVDVPLELPLGRCLDVEILETVTVQHHHAGFFRVGGVDQHALGHSVLNSGVPPEIVARPLIGRAASGGWKGLREGARPAGERMQRRACQPRRQGRYAGLPLRKGWHDDRSPASARCVRGNAAPVRIDCLPVPELDRFLGPARGLAPARQMRRATGDDAASAGADLPPIDECRKSARPADGSRRPPVGPPAPACAGQALRGVTRNKRSFAAPRSRHRSRLDHEQTGPRCKLNPLGRLARARIIQPLRVIAGDLSP